MVASIREALSSLAAVLASPREELVVAGEGNLSWNDGSRTLLVSPSGYRLASIAPEAWVEVDGSALVDALGTPLDDDGWLRVIQSSRTRPEAPRPTVEVALHAVIADEIGAGFVAHTHPTPLLPLLCSGQLEAFATDRLIPDHAVMLGVADCVVPYVDPGQTLARVTREAIRGHIERYQEPPRVVLAANHGIFVHGATQQEVIDRTRMVVKVARARVAGAGLGGLTALTAAQVARIVGREDERFRRGILGRP